MSIRESTSVIWQIFRRDVKRLVQNPIALIVVIGVLFLPSVYAWLTIGADWDPYGKTDALKVGIASEDTGADNSLVGHINIGEAVVDEIKNDHHLGWQFVDAEQAKQGVWSGEYYASIVIPADFSRDFLSVLDGNFTKPTIDYYVNQKISAVAPELTDSGATTVENEINAEFISTVSKTVVQIAQAAGTKVEAGATAAASNLQNDLTTVNGDVNQVSHSIDSLCASLDSAKIAITDAKNIVATLQSTLPGLEGRLSSAQDHLGQLNTLNQANSAEVTGRLNEAAARLGAAADKVQEINVPSELTDLNKLKEDLIRQLTGAASTIQGLSGSLSEQITPDLANSLSHFAGALGTLNGAVASLGPILTSTQSALDQLTTTLDLAQTAGATVQTALQGISGSLNTAQIDLSALSSSRSVQQMAEFLHLNPSEISEFMASPVTLKTETLYPIKNYGTGVAPFFTNIALWVAGFILVAILHLSVDPEGLPKFTVTQAYLGRLATFVLLGILQSLIVCTGDLIMGIQCANPAAYLFAGVVAVIVYVNIMYALVYTMRHIGRAIGVVILIMQIPGASGEYPVQMMPQFFQAIHPFLPFTYSIDAMREATGGMYGNQYWVDLLCLMPFLVLALVLGLVAGRRAFNLNALFDQELSVTDFLITEPAGSTAKTFRLQNLLQALLESKTYRQQVQDRAAKFQRRYHWLIRLGWSMIILIPIAILLINIVLPHDPETKLILLLCLVLGIIAAAVYLIVVEYINANLTHQIAATRTGGKNAKNARKATSAKTAAKARNATKTRSATVTKTTKRRNRP